MWNRRSWLRVLVIYRTSSSSSGRGTASAWFHAGASGKVEEGITKRKGPVLVQPRKLPSSRGQPRPRRVPGRVPRRTREQDSLSAVTISFSSGAWSNKGLPNEFPRQPKEWFFKVIVRLGRNFEVLDVLLSMESHLAGLYFSLLQICRFGGLG